MISETIGKKTHVLGTPDTKRNGLNTLNARKAFTSKPSGIIFAKRALNPLDSSNRSKKNTHTHQVIFDHNEHETECNAYPMTTMKKSSKFHPFRKYEPGCITKPNAIIFITHSDVKITIKIVSIFSNDVFVIFESADG